MDKETVKSEITKLVEKYNREKEKHYNEEATKDGFIKPLFTALGWDFTNLEEVAPEEKVSRKRVDYAFRISGIPKFFLEAKALNEDLDGYRLEHEKKMTFAEQAINYAYYKGCNWAILTSFKEIRVYDAWAKASSSSFRFSLRFDNLLSDFDNGLYLLSREAFEHERLDEKYSTKARKRPITEQLLSDFTNFRNVLSKDVYSLNKSKRLTEEELDEAIQRLFDRLIFIRNCEDRELEPYDLLSALRQWEEKRKGTLVSKIRELFTHFDDTYNSKIFSKHLCDQVDIGDDALSLVINGLYTTEGGSIQYDFSLIDADVLGNIYEQYLGHILKKTKERTKLTESKAKRKEEGIYYTPSYIVNYIVRNTVGELLKKKKIDLSKVKVLDLACGSGSFLIKSFDVLNEYYSKKEGYNQNKLDTSGSMTTYSTKLSILKDNIFGVDLDKQAVDIAQLNLLLKIAEKKERLPTLQENIKNGNSVIEDSILAGDKAFKWNEEFADIMRDGGFDIIIGNPPYVSNWTLSRINRPEVEYLSKTFSEVTIGHWDLYIMFIFKALTLLNKDGLLSFIVPSSFGKEKYGKKLRELIIKKYSLVCLVEFGTEGVFTDVARKYMIFIVQKKFNPDNVTRLVRYQHAVFEPFGDINQKEFLNFNNYTFRTDLKQIDMAILKKASQNTILLGEICCINPGVVAHSRKGSPVKFTKDSVIHDSYSKDYKKYVEGKEISRYNIRWGGQYIDYKNNVKYFHRPKFPELFDRNKIIVRRISGENNRLMLLYDQDQFYTNDNLLNLILWDDEIIKLQSPGKLHIYKPYGEFTLPYLAGILGSKLMSYLFSKFFATGTLQGTYSGVYPEDLRKIPIKLAPKSEQERLSRLVENINEMNKELNELKQIDKKLEIEEAIKKLDTQIDNFVYQIYGITEKEKKIIEESLK